MKKRRRMYLFLALAAVMMFPGRASAAEKISIDGSFSDWNGIAVMALNNHYQASAVYDDVFLYLHVKEGESNPWDSLPTLHINVDGTVKGIVLNKGQATADGEILPLQVMNSWWIGINNASGVMMRENNRNEWEVRIPVRTAFTANECDRFAYNTEPYEVGSISILWNLGSEVVTQVAVSIEDASSAETPTPVPSITPMVTPTPVPSVTPTAVPTGAPSQGKTSFVIDGYYDDWEGIPKTKISYGSHNREEYHEAALVTDGDYLYAYVRMCDLYHSQIPVNEYYLTINGVTKAFNILGCDSEGNVDYRLNVYRLPYGRYATGLGVFYRDNKAKALGEAALTITEGFPNDTLEFRISLSVLEELYGLQKGTIANGSGIEFYNPNLGSEKVVMVGTSTGTVVGIALCVASVGAVLFYRKRRKLIGA